MRDGFFLMICLLLSCGAIGCLRFQPQSVEAPHAEGPFAALHGLSRQVSAMAELARVDSASQVPGGQGEGRTPRITAPASRDRRRDRLGEYGLSVLPSAG